jgi:hypothetical protein
MLERGLAAELSCKVTLDFAATGLICRIAAPSNQCLANEQLRDVR